MCNSKHSFSCLTMSLCLFSIFCITNSSLSSLTTIYNSPLNLLCTVQCIVLLYDGMFLPGLPPYTFADTPLMTPFQKSWQEECLNVVSFKNMSQKGGSVAGDTQVTQYNTSTFSIVRKDPHHWQTNYPNKEKTIIDNEQITCPTCWKWEWHQGGGESDLLLCVMIFLPFKS